MSYQKVRDFLDSKGFTREIMTMPESTATVDLAAAAIGVEPDRIAKTLAFAQGEGCTVIVVSGRARIDNKKYKAAFGTKAKMLSFEDTLAATGHAVGGVCPFGLPEGVRICLDASLKDHTEVYPAAGESNTCLCLSLQELEELTGGEWVDVCSKAL